MQWVRLNRFKAGGWVPAVSLGGLVLLLMPGPGLAEEYDYDPTFDHSRPGWLYHHEPGRYGYAVDPYDRYSEPFPDEQYDFSPYGYDFYNSPQFGRGHRNLQRANRARQDLLYGYVPDERGRAAAPFRDDGWIYGYYYDRSGELEYGWHRQLPPAAVAPPGKIGHRPASSRPAASSQARLVRFEGEVTKVTSVTGRTDNVRHQVARIREPDGTFRAVELGPAGRWAVREGDRINGDGVEGFVRGRPTVLAEWVRVDGAFHQIERHAARKLRNYEGEVTATARLKLVGEKEPQLVAQVFVADRRMATVLLGPAAALRGADLTSGDQIAFWARDAFLNQLPVLMAEQIEVNGRIYKIPYDRDQYYFETP